MADPERHAQGVWDELLEELRDVTLGDYEVVGLLGRGGMAAVYLAHEIALDRKVAIKVMAPSLMVDPGMIERFGHEARTMAALNHRHIVAIYQVQAVERLYFFVMQFIQGCALSELIPPEGLPIRVVQAVLQQVGAALEYAHGRRVVHRDIKPHNIMLDARGDAVVTDFGIAKVAEAPSQTLTRGSIGTPGYMSPEQCLADPLTGATDQYSLGVVAYEMLTGKMPFSGSPLALQMAHLETPPPPIRARRPDCPAELEAAVLRMLAKKPEERWASLAAAAQAIGGTPLGEEDAELRALRETIAGHSSSFTPAPVRPTPVSRRKARRTPTAPEVARLSLRRDVGQLRPGQKVRLEGTALDLPGNRIADAVLSWRSEQPEIVSVTAEGEATARRAGRARLVASCQEASASVDVVVARRVPLLVQGLLGVGAATGLGFAIWSASGGAGGKALSGDSTGIPPRSPDTVTGATGRPDSGQRGDGSDRTGAAGALRVLISPAQARVAPGEQVQLRAVLTDAGGAPATGDPVSWSSSDPLIAQVNRSGLVTARAAGSVRIRAASGTASALAAISVVAGPATGGPAPATTVARVTLTPPSARITEGDTVNLTAALLAADNTVLAGSVSWAVEDQSVAALSTRGADAAVIGRKAGSTRIWATSGGVRGEATLMVTASALPPPGGGGGGGGSPAGPGGATPDPARETARVRAASDVIRDYETAINNRDLARLRELHPTMTAARAKQWTDLFGRDVRILTARIALGAVRATGDDVTAGFELTLQFTPQGGQPLTNRIRADAVLSESGGQWRITSLREQPI